MRNPRPNVERLVYRKPDWLNDYIDRNRPLQALADNIGVKRDTIEKIYKRNTYVSADVLERMAMDAGMPLPREVYAIGSAKGSHTGVRLLYVEDA